MTRLYYRLKLFQLEGIGRGRENEIRKRVGLQTPKGRVFQGENLKGLIRRLDYIRGLGTNAIWLSPVSRNRQEKSDTCQRGRFERRQDARERRAE